MRMKPLAFLLALSTLSLVAQDVVRLGNLKFAHYGAVSYMKEHRPEVQPQDRRADVRQGHRHQPRHRGGRDGRRRERRWTPPSRAAPAGVQIYVVAGFAKGGARIVAGANSGIKSLTELKGKKVGVARGGAQEAAAAGGAREGRPHLVGQAGQGRAGRSTCPSPT